MIFGFGFPYKWQIEYLSNFMVVDLGESKETGTIGTPLSLEHFYSGFLIYAVGILGSILVFMFKETRMHYKQIAACIQDKYKLIKLSLISNLKDNGQKRN